MKITQTNRQRRRTAGFGMVEVLVTLILLSVGLMGIAKLQLVSLRSVHASAVRGQAVLLAYDLADRMRANRFGIADLDGNAVGFYNRADGATYQTPTDNDCTEGADAAADCSIDEVAAHDLDEWNVSLDGSNDGLLPGGMGWVCIDSDPSDDIFDPSDGNFDPDSAPTCDGAQTNGADVYSITVIWTDVEEAGAAPKRYNMRFQL